MPTTSKLTKVNAQSLPPQLRKQYQEYSTTFASAGDMASALARAMNEHWSNTYPDGVEIQGKEGLQRYVFTAAMGWLYCETKPMTAKRKGKAKQLKNLNQGESVFAFSGAQAPPSAQSNGADGEYNFDGTETYQGLTEEESREWDKLSEIDVNKLSKAQSARLTLLETKAPHLAG